MTPSDATGRGGLTLADYGLDERWRAHLAVAAMDTGETLAPARVTCVHRSAIDVVTAAADALADTPVTARTIALGRPGHRDDEAWPPVVGDWLAVDATGRVHTVLARRTYLARPSAGRDSHEQPVAANVDVLVIVEPFVPEVSAGRVERLTALAHSAGTSVWLVLTKADLVDSEQAGRAAGELGALVDAVHVVSSHSHQGLAGLADALAEAGTAVLLGRSGAGKSTLTNTLLGTDLATGPVRQGDAKGRHTTTSRGLVAGRGCLVIDTPGVRALASTTDSDAVDETFADVVSVAARCRFTDCRHQDEPGCAVRQAVGEGSLDAARVERYLRMSAESSRLRQRTDARAWRDQERRLSRENKVGRRTTMRLKGRRN